MVETGMPSNRLNVDFKINAYGIIISSPATEILVVVWGLGLKPKRL